jgi:predicted phosphodiesterase
MRIGVISDTHDNARNVARIVEDSVPPGSSA